MVISEIIIGAVALATQIAKTVVTIASALGVLKEVATSLLEVGQCLGLLPFDKGFEEIGDQVFQAKNAGIKPELYATFEDYKKAVESYKVDPEISNRLSPQDKIQSFLEYEIDLFQRKYPGISVEPIFTAFASFNKFFTPERTAQLALVIKDNINLLVDVVNFVSGEETNFSKQNSVLEILTPVEKALEPGITDVEAQKRITDCL